MVHVGKDPSFNLLFLQKEAVMRAISKYNSELFYHAEAEIVYMVRPEITLYLEQQDLDIRMKIVFSVAEKKKKWS